MKLTIDENLHKNLEIINFCTLSKSNHGETPLYSVSVSICPVTCCNHINQAGISAKCDPTIGATDWHAQLCPQLPCYTAETGQLCQSGTCTGTSIPASYLHRDATVSHDDLKAYISFSFTFYECSVYVEMCSFGWEPRCCVLFITFYLLLITFFMKWFIMDLSEPSLCSVRLIFSCPVELFKIVAECAQLILIHVFEKL